MEIRIGKRNGRQRSWSDEVGDKIFTRKRVFKTLEVVLEYAGKSLQTKTYFRPFNENELTEFSIPPVLETTLSGSKFVIFPCGESSFNKKYDKFMQIANLLMQNQEEKTTNKKDFITLKKEKISHNFTIF